MAQGSGLQFRAAEWKYPWGAAKFLQDHHITSAMLNSYVDGGFLMWRLWPQEKVFIDGRALSDNVFEDFTKIAYNITGSDPRQLLANKYGIETIVLDGFEYTLGRAFPADSGAGAFEAGRVAIGVLGRNRGDLYAAFAAGNCANRQRLRHE